MAIKLADTLKPMADFPAVYAKDLYFNDEESLQKKYDDGKLGGINFREYTSDVEFNSDELVIYDRIIYKVAKDFTSSNFNEDLENGNLTIYIGGNNADVIFKDYIEGEQYKEKEYIAYNHILYKVLKEFTSTDFDTDLTNKNIEKYIGIEDNSILNWEKETEYSDGDIRLYNDNKYQAIKSHTSSALFETDVDNWIQLIETYALVTEDQYDYLKNNNLLENKLYIKVNSTERETMSTEEYEEVWNNIVINPT